MGADQLTVRTLHDIFWRFLVPVALAVLSFVIYACTVFALPQVRNARYCCEQSGIAAAVSNIRYGAPLGSLYSGVYDFFVAHLFEPLEQTLEPQTLTASLPATPSGELFETTRDGNGIGYPLVATAAFRLFGLHAWALTLTMLLLMALSAATFLLRFSGAAFASVVILYFSALTVMLFTTMEWDPTYTINVPVGGIRYFSLSAYCRSFTSCSSCWIRMQCNPEPENGIACYLDCRRRSWY